MAANDAYREYIRKLTTCKTPKQVKTALAKVLSSNIAFVGTVKPTHEEYHKVLAKAESEFGGGNVVGVHIAWNGHSWEALAVYRKNGTLLVVETKPARFSYEKLLVGCHAYDVGAQNQTPLLFRLTAWLARSIFGVTDAKPFPILHKFAIDQLDLSTETSLNTMYKMPEFLRTLDMYVTSVALAASAQIDAEEASIVDVLHCFGLVYVGSLNEVTSDDEGVHLRATLSLAKIQDGYDHLWWIEDFTVYEEDHYNLVVRFNIDNHPMYMKRRLKVTAGGKRFVDLDSTKVSSKICWEEGLEEAGICEFNKWVESLLPSTAKAMPYMRHEIIKRYHVLRPRRLLFMVRPYLVNGVPGLLPSMHNSSLPPRLFYSPDLFVEPSKIPQGNIPTTVLGEVLVKPWILAREIDVQVFLKLEGEEDHAYRILFTKQGELFPELNQVRIFVQSQNKSMLDKDAIQLVVLRRNVGPGGSILVEFVLTSYCRPFTLCTDSMMCDFNVRLTTFTYDARDEPVVFPPIQLLLWSNRVSMVSEKHNLPLEKAYEKTWKMIGREKRCMVPLIFAQPFGETFYSFSFCEGKDFVRMKPTTT